MKIVTVVGARPQFIKAAPVCKALREAGQREYLVHTGQHYDRQMSAVFFEELGIPTPDINLGVGSGSHGKQTAEMLVGIEKVLEDQSPDWVLVYGDTNSTLAGALAAVKLHIPIAHVEAGLRSFNREMPEEYNRVLTDHCADLLFCPTQTAVDNIARESITKGVHWVGDTMYDAVLQFSEVALKRSTILKGLQIEPKSYLLATVHRPYNTDQPEKLRGILSAFIESRERIIFPVHPRTCSYIKDLEISLLESSKVQLVPPVGYLDMLVLEQNARMILTDSGGIQKEAYFFQVPCVTLRPETEWVETVASGWNQIAGADPIKILSAIQSPEVNRQKQNTAFGSGKAAYKIIDILTKNSKHDDIN